MKFESEITRVIRMDDHLLVFEAEKDGSPMTCVMAKGAEWPDVSSTELFTFYGHMYTHSHYRTLQMRVTAARPSTPPSDN